MQIPFHPLVQQDPGKRPGVVRIGVNIYQPVWWGQPCNWEFLFGNEAGAMVMHLPSPEDDPYFASRWHPSRLRHFIDCGDIPSSHYGLALELIDSCARGDRNSRDSISWVFSSLIKLSSRCAMNFIPRVDETLRHKMTERPIGFMDELGYTRPERPSTFE
ncbi:hypothetical protein PEBR_16358 [Penicillium brasilianum]|uniref:Uncharacterized protein n=1 Tax=Penicillium brasilianum TaxID=104259 RepID=A0A1S9RR20_PENBI|nr:hypothetical protein PEBR_16358 [Penicillium brasilianum]